MNLGTRSANVTIGENNITDVTFTNQDPPEGTSPGDGSLTGGGAGGSTSGSGATSGGSRAASGGSTGGSGGSTGGSGGSTAGSTGGGGGGSTTTGDGGGGAEHLDLRAVDCRSVHAAGSPRRRDHAGPEHRELHGRRRDPAEAPVTLATLRQELATNKAKLKTLFKQKAAAKTLARKHFLAKQIAVLEAKDLNLAKAIKKLA